VPHSGPIVWHRPESGRALPLLVWRFVEPLRAIASGPFGGGIGERAWVLNATVDRDYARLDPDVHIVELATLAGLSGSGVGLLTAVDVLTARTAEDEGVTATATVGLGYPTLAAAPAAPAQGPPGTINVVVQLPVRLQDAALVNAVATATEAKVQALWDCGVNATGTATDALFIGSASGGPGEPYGGPRSVWGARLARAVYSAVAEGTRHWMERTSPGRTSPP
jgi:adenosylcobinamide hydrolase